MRATRRGALYAFIFVVCFMIIAPVLWMVSASLKPVNEVLDYPPSLLPSALHWENYAKVFSLQPFGSQLFNSIFIMAAVCLLTLAVSVTAGYALARIKPRGSAFLFIFILSGIFMPPEALIIPLYKFASNFGWIDTHWPLIIFTTFFTSAPIATFVMRQAFIQLPREFGEAAIVDGASRSRVFLGVYTPMVRPSIAAVVVLSAWYSWNQYLEPLVYLRSTDKFTAPLALTQFNDPFAGPLWNVQMAATTISILPMVVLFIFAQRHVIAGLTAGGLKS